MAYKDKRWGYRRKVNVYFVTSTGVTWLEKNKGRLPVAMWTAASERYSKVIGRYFIGKSFRSIGERCRAIDRLRKRNLARAERVAEP